jgi:hypothetical protein
VLEALRARCPLALSRIPAHLEVAGPGVPDFAPDDPRECALAIRAALASPPPEELKGRYSWDSSARLLVEGWCQALAGR